MASETDLLENRLAELVVQRGMVSASVVSACRAQQRETLERGEPMPRLSQLLVKSGHLRADQLVDILRGSLKTDFHRDVSEAYDPLLDTQYQAPLLGGRTSLGKYQLRGELSRGGVGVVFEAFDPELGRHVALKVLRDQNDGGEQRKRLQREAELAGRLSHPHIISVHEVGVIDGVHYIAMELVRGPTLHTAMPGMSLQDRIRLLERVARAVGFAHGEGVIHRDLKPANILISSRGGREGEPVLIDFGLARKQAEDRTQLTRTGAVMGTAVYMAPEQILGKTHEIDARTDVWALGIMLYEMLVGERPFDGKTPAEVYQRILHDEARTMRDHSRRVPAPLELICRKALRKTRANRYNDGNEMADDLARWQSGDTVLAAPPATISRLTQGLRRRPRLVLVGLLLSFGLLALIWLRAAAQDAAELDRLRVREQQRRAEDRASRRALQEGERYRLFQQKLQPLLREIGGTRSVFYIQSLAQMRQRLGEVERVVGELAKLAAVPANARNALLWSLQGIGWYYLGRQHQAERCLLRASELDPKDGAVHYYLGRLYLDRAVAVRFTFGVEDPQAVARRWTQRAVAVMSRASNWGGVGQIDRRLALAYRALAEGRDEDVLRLSRDGLSRFVDQLGVEEFWSLIGLVEKKEKRAAAFRKVIAGRPHSAWQLFFLGSMAHQRGQLDQAIAHYAACLAINPHFELAYNGRAVAHQERGEMAAAVADLDSAIRTNPQSMQAWLNRGSIRNKLGDRQGALADFDEAIRLNPKIARGYHYRGLVLLELKRYDEAIQMCEKAISIRPRFADAWSNRGNAYYLRRDYVAALRDYDQAIMLAPTSGKAYYNRGNLRALRGNLAGAQADFEQTTKHLPRFAPGWAHRGRMAFRQGDFKAALSYFEQALSLDDKVAAIHYNRGNAHHNLAQYARAIADYDRSLALDDSVAETYRARGNARELSGDAPGALRDYDEAIKRDVRLARAWANRAGLKAGMKDLTGAVVDYKVATQLEPSDWASWYGCGLTLARLKQYDRAVVALRRARRVAPERLKQRIDSWVRKIGGMR